MSRTVAVPDEPHPFARFVRTIGRGSKLSRPLDEDEAAVAMMQGVFHPTYLETHLETARLLGQKSAAIFKGGGGEAQRNPEKTCRALTLSGGAVGEEVWPAITKPASHGWRDEPMEPARIGALWRGELAAPGPEAAVVGTAAIALELLGHAPTVEAAEALAREMWEARPRKRFDRPRPLTSCR
jgi:anthranilate phosphoribosyltransferase